MKIGFAIISHKMPDKIFERLLTQLDKFPDRQIVVHHDFSQAGFDDELVKKFNIEFTDISYKTTWCSFTVVTATFDCIKKFNNVDWIILLSANDYPIKDADTINKFLSDTTYNAFMDGTEVTSDKTDWPLANWTYNMVYKKILFKIPSFDRKVNFKWRPVKVKRSRNPFNKDYKLYFGSQWFIIDKKVAEYLKTIDTTENNVVQFLSTAEKCKDEIIFQTLIHNKPDFKISKKSYRFIDWENAKNWHPNIITSKQLNDLKKSDSLFARKFEWNESQEVINLIDKEILYTKS